MSSAVIDPLSRASGVMAQGGEATAGRSCTLYPRGNKRGNPLRIFPAFVSFLVGYSIRFVALHRTVSTVSRRCCRAVGAVLRSAFFDRYRKTV